MQLTHSNFRESVTCGVGFSFDQAYVAVGSFVSGDSERGFLTTYQWPNLQQYLKIPINLGRFYGFALHPHRLVAVAYGDKGFQILDYVSGQVLHQCDEIGGECAAFSPDGKGLLISQSGKQIWYVDLKKYDLLPCCYNPEFATSISFHPEGKDVLVAAVSQEGDSSLWFIDLNHNNYLDDILRGEANSHREYNHEWGENLEIGMNFSQEVRAASFSRDGKYIACVHSLVKVYDYPHLRLAATFTRKGNPTLLTYEGPDYSTWEDASFWSNPVFSADSSHLICQSPDGFVNVWDIENNRLIQRFEGNVGSYRYLALSPDGQFLASIGSENNLRIHQL